MFEQPPITPQMETSARIRPIAISQMGSDVIVGSLSFSIMSLSISVAMPIANITTPTTLINKKIR